MYGGEQHGACYGHRRRMMVLRRQLVGHQQFGIFFNTLLSKEDLL